jgi:hypothetical protein
LKSNQRLSNSVSRRRKPEFFQVAANAAEGDQETPTTPAPVLNGKRVLPYKVLAAGLKGYEVAGVYAIMNKDYKRG